MRKRHDSLLSIARGLITRHGGQAMAVAREHTAQSTASGDLHAASRWHAVLRAVEQLRSETRASAS